MGQEFFDMYRIRFNVYTNAYIDTKLAQDGV